jgi:hypothetical protein
VPTPPAVPSVLKVIFRQTLGSDTSVSTTLHFSYTGTAPNDATCLLLAEQFWLAYSNHLTPLLDTAGSLVGTDVIDLTSETSGSAAYAATSAGTRAEGTLTGGSVSLVNCTVARRYRGGKPRQYWPFGGSTDLTTEQAWSSSYQAAFATAYDAFIAACQSIVESGCTVVALVNVSLYKGFVSSQNPITGRWRNLPTYRTGTIPVDVILSAALNPKPGSQRRRNLHST